MPTGNEELRDVMSGKFKSPLSVYAMGSRGPLPFPRWPSRSFSFRLGSYRRFDSLRSALGDCGGEAVLAGDTIPFLQAL